MPSLVILNLTQNSLSGNIPRQLCRMPALIADDSSTSDLRNLPLPLLIDGRQYYGLFNLRRGMAVGGNNLVGGIPDEMGQLKLLQELDLSSNNFNGGITSQLSSLTNLEKMDISRNHLCVDELIPENNDSLETDQEAAAKEINKKTMRKIRVVVPEDKHTSPVKVKFRMGKVVDLQSDNNSPRKLRFRRARVLGAEDSKGDLRRRTSKKAGVNGDTAGTGDSSQKVVLKHQDVQGKKDAQGLLNNVIEETASKLAVSRKSKVKALVGAFETVISLQEMKPSTQVVS